MAANSLTRKDWWAVPRTAFPLAVAVGLLAAAPATAQVERVWLTHRSADPSRLMVNWTTQTPGDSLVRYGPTGVYGAEALVPGRRTVHHVRIPLPADGTAVHYAVVTGDQTSPDATIKGYPVDGDLRVAVVANWQSKPDLAALLKDDPHLLLTAGDNVPDLWHAGGVGAKDSTKSFEALIDRYPTLFRSVPFLPALGNHDREIRPRGPKPPAEAVYDVDATAFRSFFPLPDDAWKWHFDVPAFRVRFVALDLNHTSDRGTTWQTCHDWGRDSEQFGWYRKLMEDRPPGFVVTLFNERNATVRGLDKGVWPPLIQKGTLAISGFGYFGERAEAGGFPYWNTSLGGTGAKYPDPGSTVFKSEDNYLLLTIPKGGETMAVELKSLAGAVLERQEYTAAVKADRPAVSGPRTDVDGFLVHDVTSPYQSGPTTIRVLLPEEAGPPKRGRTYPVVYVLPVEAGAGNKYGDGLKEVKKLGLHTAFQAIFVAPTFTALPWYADHPTRPDLRQEAHVLDVVVPFVDRTYPTRAGPGGRHLLGFSKSGWGAYTLLLRHPNVFGKAAAWDAPLMLDAPGKYGSGDVFGTPDRFRDYQVTRLLAVRADTLRGSKRLALLGHGNFRPDHEQAHALMDRLGVAHEYRDGPTRPHDWHSGWLEDAAAFVLARAVADVRVSADGKRFVEGADGRPFAPWGFNYDRDAAGRLIEDYWETEWDKVERDFRTMRRLGANVVRVHLQFGKFMDAADRPNEKALDRLVNVLRLAEREGLHLDLTGLGCYHKADVPAWYDRLAEPARWDAQAAFWRAVAGRCKDSPAVFCYDLMNEPVVPGGPRPAGDWLGPPFAGKHYVQCVALDPAGRPRVDIARAWVKHLTAAIRAVDGRHLVTVGLVDWSLDRPGLSSGFDPTKVAADLDFLCVHLYPEAGKLDEATATLKGFGAAGKPVVVEETFPLKCSPAELDGFIDRSAAHAAGWVSFYWGTPPAELRRSAAPVDALILDWLTRFGPRAGAATR